MNAPHSTVLCASSGTIFPAYSLRGIYLGRDTVCLPHAQGKYILLRRISEDCSLGTLHIAEHNEVAGYVNEIYSRGLFDGVSTTGRYAHLAFRAEN